MNYFVYMPKEWAKDSHSARLLVANKMTQNGFLYNKEQMFGGIARRFSIGGEDSGFLTWAELSPNLRVEMTETIQLALPAIAISYEETHNNYKRTDQFDNTFVHKTDPNKLVREIYADSYRSNDRDDDSDDDDDSDSGMQFYVPENKLKELSENVWNRLAPREFKGTAFPEPVKRNFWYKIPHLGMPDDAHIVSRNTWNSICRGHRGSWRGDNHIVLDKHRVDDSIVGKYWVVLISYEAEN